MTMLDLSNPDRYLEFRARMNMVAIRTYLLGGLRVTRGATNAMMLDIAIQTTGVDYRRGQARVTKEMLLEALLDLEKIFPKRQPTERS